MDNKKITTFNGYRHSSKLRFNNYKKSFQINDIFPDDVIKLGECVGQKSVVNFEQKDIDEYEEIIVVEAFSPSHFYIHQRKNILEFYDMMENLHNFYEQYKSHYIIPKIAFQPGLHIAVKYFYKWHRAIVKKADDYPEIEVLFFDYGTTKFYQSNELYFLQSQFGQLPGQAVLCSLFNIRPINTETWSLLIRQHFFKKIINKSLAAVVGKIIKKNNSLMVDLIDTSKEEDIHLNDWLVEKYDAEYRITRCKHHNFLYQYDLVCNGVRPPNKQPILPSSSTRVNKNCPVNKKVNNSSYHTCPKCGNKFNDENQDNINSTPKNLIINSDNKSLSHENIYDAEQSFLSHIKSNESSGYDAIDWERLKDTSDEKVNDKYKITKKVLTTAEILKHTVKSKRNVEVVDEWYKEYLKQNITQGFDVINDYVDVCPGEMTSIVKKITRTITQDLPRYNAIVFSSNVVQHNGKHVTKSIGTSKELLSAGDDSANNENNKRSIISNKSDKVEVVGNVDIVGEQNNNDKLNFVETNVPIKKQDWTNYIKGIWLKNNNSAGSPELDSDDLSSEEDLDK